MRSRSSGPTPGCSVLCLKASSLELDLLRTKSTWLRTLTGTINFWLLSLLLLFGLSAWIAS